MTFDRDDEDRGPRPHDHASAPRKDIDLVSEPGRSPLLQLVLVCAAVIVVAAVVYVGAHQDEVRALFTSLIQLERQAIRAASSPSSEPNNPPAAHGITNPDWIRKPSGADFARYYPQRALSLGLNGRVAISCAVKATGELTSCHVLSEDPPNYGFGEAALKIAGLWRMRPMMKDGRPADGGTFQTTIRFNIEN